MAFNKETGIIDMTKQNTFDNSLEEKLFDYMYKASVDGYLESKELEKWCRKNYDEFFGLIKKFESTEINKLSQSCKYFFNKHVISLCRPHGA